MKQSITSIINFRQWLPRLANSGMPTKEQISLLAQAGFNTIINLATFDPLYSLPDELTWVEDNKMSYVHIPVVWTAPKVEDFELFESTVLALPESKILVHCHLNYRASVFLFIYRVKSRREPVEPAWSQMTDVWRPDAIWGNFIEKCLST